MPYCTEDDLRALVDGYDHLLRGRETDFSAQIAMAQAWIDAYLEAAGIRVPLSSPPPFVRLAVANYAAYLITSRPDSDGSLTGYAAHFKAEAERLRDDYLRGKADIPGQDVMPREYGAIPKAVNPPCR